MSNNATSAANQQGSPLAINCYDPSETTRRTPISQDEIKAYFLGAIHDGTFSSNKRYRISQKRTNWLKILQKLLKQLGFNSWLYKEGKTRNVYVLETLAPFLNFNFNHLRLNSKKTRKCYIKGFFDSEGGIPHNSKARFYIQLTQSDRKKLNQLKSLLNDLGIDSGKIHNPSKKVDPNYWRLYVLANSHHKFIEQIGSWHPRKIKILEKRMKI